MAELAPQRLRVGVVGAGAIARDYAAVLARSDQLEIAAVADPVTAARDALAASTGAPAFGSARELLAEVEVDAALVLTPPAAHETVATELLQRGVHVLCEKPLALTAPGASRMFHAATRARAHLMMASKFRYVPDLIEAQRLLASGALGEPILYDNAFCTRVAMTERWNADPPTSGGGVLIDNGSHAVDIARFLLGPLVRMLAHFGRRVQPVRVEDSVRVLFETTTACVGLIDLSWSLENGADHYVAVRGTAGTLQVGWRGSRYRLHGEAEWRAFGSGYDKRAALAAQLANFAAVIRRREEPVVTAEDAMASVRAIEAAYRSARVGRWVPLYGYAG